MTAKWKNNTNHKTVGKHKKIFFHSICDVTIYRITMSNAGFHPHTIMDVRKESWGEMENKKWRQQKGRSTILNFSQPTHVVYS